MEGAAWALGVVLAVTGWVAGQAPATQGMSRGESRNVWGYDPTEDFIAYDKDYRAKHARYTAELRELQLELARQAAAGRATPCSRQIFLEARWLTFYSAHWERIEKKLGELREMLSRPADPPDAREQVEADGSFDHCSDAWFLKLDSTIEEVEYLTERGKKPRYSLKLLDRINSPEKLRGYLDSLLVSDVRKTGMDSRFELNIAITSIERFIVGHVETDYAFHPELKKALFEYEDDYWQDPKTGYFGGWYRLADGSIRKTVDLSVTFHIASYRRDSLRRVAEIGRTTLAIRDYEYPFGWREEGQPSNHHNYDVVRLLRMAWPYLSDEERERARGEFRGMIQFCLGHLRADGSFDMLDEDTLGSSFLFPVSLLNELGYFRPSLRFWTNEDFPEAMGVADRVERRIREMGLTDTESAKVLARFEEARVERRVRWGVVGGGVAVVILVVVGGWMVRRRRRRMRRLAVDQANG